MSKQIDAEELTELISFRLPTPLAAKIRVIARRESNGVSAVCRRLLSVAVKLEEQS